MVEDAFMVLWHLKLPGAGSDSNDDIKKPGPALVDKLEHLKGCESARMITIFEQFPIIAHSLHDLRPCDAPSARNFELTDCNPIAVKLHRESL